MGEAYKARDARLDRIVAIKILPEAPATDPQFRDRFDREARAISQLTHSNICTLDDVGEQAGTAYLVMELLDGETLAERLARVGRTLSGPPSKPDPIGSGLPVNEALTIAVQMTKAGAKLLDFGLAKARGVGVAQDFQSCRGRRSCRRRHV